MANQGAWNGRGWVWMLVVCAVAVGQAGCSSSKEGTKPDDVQGDTVVGDTTVLPDAAGDASPDGPSGDLAAEAREDDLFADAEQDVRQPPLATLIPGPGMEGYDADLEALARRYDRQFHVFTAYGNGVNADVSVPAANTADRADIEAFLRDHDGWDFEAFSGKKPEDVVTTWHKVAGLYGGVGIAADAYRYSVLRDQGYPAEEVDRAREFLLLGLDRLHMAQAITGVPGVIARGFIRLDIPSYGATLELVDLFDGEGNPLPAEKTNGTWRADNSGLYPNWVWEDSCSRDMHIGWMAAFGAAWEVIRDDATFPKSVKDQLQADALELGNALRVVRESGYDLEIPDADGRTTFHGYLNEDNIDRIYFPGVRNGFHAIMALGAVATLVFVSEDPDLKSYLWDELIGQRDFVGICKDSMMLVDMGNKTNYSNVNMAFQGAWLAVRYLTDSPAVRADLQLVLQHRLYDNGGTRQPSELGQSLFDFMTAAGIAGATLIHPLGTVDTDIMGRGLQTLREFPVPPFWDLNVEHCDEAEIEALFCVAEDSSDMPILGYVGRNDDLIAVHPLPMRLRPPSNYFWRSNPYKPNGGGDGSGMNPGVDFRYAYWLGRFVK